MVGGRFARQRLGRIPTSPATRYSNYGTGCTPTSTPYLIGPQYSVISCFLSFIGTVLGPLEPSLFLLNTFPGNLIPTRDVAACRGHCNIHSSSCHGHLDTHYILAYLGLNIRLQRTHVFEAPVLRHLLCPSGYTPVVQGRPAHTSPYTIPQPGHRSRY